MCRDERDWRTEGDEGVLAGLRIRYGSEGGREEDRHEVGD